jgi:predicted MFS family arabinose efflux permease
LLASVVPDEQVPRALTVEAVFMEVAFVTGPAVAGGLAWLGGPEAALAAMAAAAAGSAWLAGGLPAHHPAPVGDLPAAWRLPGVAPVLAIAAAVGVGVGAYEGALPERMAALGVAAESAGGMLALLAAGSAVGGLVAARRRDLGATPARTGVALLLALGMLLTASAPVPSVLGLGAVLVVAGLPLAPLNALGTIVLQRRVPEGRRSEGFALYLAGVLLGAGAGQLVAGTLLERADAATVLTLAAALPFACGAAVAAARRAAP